MPTPHYRPKAKWAGRSAGVIFLKLRNRNSRSVVTLSGQYDEVCAMPAKASTGCGKGAKKKVSWGLGGSTYQDDGAAEDQVPQQVLLLVELGICGFELAQVLEDEIRVKNNTELRPSQEKARDKSPDLGRQFEDLEVVKVEPGNRE